jgi:alanyl-tRNA synthetase
MTGMDTATIRQAFLDYFAERDHRVVASSPLVPGNDPTLLFTNAGMVQFKDVFLGDEQRNYRRATSSQRCVRAGGKHNDLENVGYTARHHTFFEMLGNFSFGDYFKRDAIAYAWEFMTGVLGLPADRLWVTVYKDDDEAAAIWLDDIGVDPSRFSRLGDKDNFWSMGDTGPCGPCSEIFFDHGAEVPGGPPGSADEDGDRYVEVWNLVFMQFNRAANGELTPLPSPSVDTGMGLERIAAVMQGVHSNYDIDLFRSIIAAAAEVTGCSDETHASLRVIADHIRACSFLIADGVLPGNEGRGYVLRRIIRRALRHGYELGTTEAFFHRLVTPLCEQMGTAYPELVESKGHIEKVLRREEDRFAETLSHGMGMLEEALDDLDGERELSGDVVFRLYDTYGFPVDLTADIARGRGLSVDQAGFEAAMNEQRARARAAHRFGGAQDTGERLDVASRFTGYESLEGESEILALVKEGVRTNRLSEGEDGGIVLAVTPFYAESGGQVGDTGRITAGTGSFDVLDTQKNGDAIVHVGKVSTGYFKAGNLVCAGVDAVSRSHTVLNHSATHLLHAALREVLGGHVAQKGSLVAPDRLRFDFSHFDALTADELSRIELRVNEEIRANHPASTDLKSYDEAIEAGAVALFGEKYGDEVRVLSIGDYSTELCGGTHVARSGDIGLFVITSESGIAAGVRRIEAVTGIAALEWTRASKAALEAVATLVKGNRDDAVAKVGALADRARLLEKEVQALKSRLAGAGSGGRSIGDDCIEIAGIQVVAEKLDDELDAKTLRDAVDRLKDKLGTAVIVLASVSSDGKVRLAAGVTRDVTGVVKAGNVVNAVAEQVGGRGGGRPDFAQAGGNDPSGLVDALASVKGFVKAAADP